MKFQESIFFGLENKFKKLHTNTIFLLLVIGVLAVGIRAYYFPYEIPFSYDALDYFSYATVMSKIGHFPNNWPLVNNGWPSFISIFFSMMNYENIFDFIHTQRFLSVTISILTIIPVYLISKKYFSRTYSFIATALFVFNPRIIENSLLGITESLYLFLITFAVLFVLSKNKFQIYISFILIALVAITRYEGLLLFIPFSIIFFVRNKNERRKIIKYLLALIIFLLIIIPIAYLRVESSGQDGFISHYTSGLTYVSSDLVTGEEEDEEWIIKGENNIPVFLSNAFFGLGKMFGILTLPFYVFLIPLSLLVIFTKKENKKINSDSFSILIILGTMTLPALYAFGRNIEDPRLIFVFLPFLCLLSIPILKNIEKKINHKQIPITFFILIIIFSFLIMEYQKNDYPHEREVYQIAQIVINNADGINSISPESRYFKSAEVERGWPNKINLDKDNPGHISREIKRIVAEKFETLDEFLIESEKIGITHLIVDGKENRAEFLNQIYKNDKNFSFLKKIYDSNQDGLKYHVKIYLIDFEEFKNNYSIRLN